MKRKVMFSVTSTSPSGAMTMSETNFFSCCSRRCAEAGTSRQRQQGTEQGAGPAEESFVHAHSERRLESGGWGSGIPEADFGGFPFCGG